MTLEELKAQRKALDDQIKALQNNARIAGRTKLDMEHFPTARPDEWGVYVRRDTGDTDLREQWKCVIKDTDKEKVIGKIPELVKDLQELFNKACDELRKGGTT